MVTITVKEAKKYRNPVFPKFVFPPSFDPCTSNVITFLRDYEKASDINQWQSVHKIQFFRHISQALQIFGGKNTVRMRLSSTKHGTK